MRLRLPEGVVPATVKAHHLHRLQAGLLDGTLTRYAGQRAAGHTVNLKVRTWRQFFRFLCDQRYLHQDPTTGLVRSQETEGEITWLYGANDHPHRDEIGCLLRAAKIRLSRHGSLTALRDYVCIWVQLDTGIRPGELLRLEEDDVDLEGLTIHVRADVAKTKTWRYLDMVDTSAHLIREYLNERSAFEFRCPQVFCSSMGNRTRAGTVQPMASGAYSKILSTIAREAGLTKKVTAYTLRHTFARQFLREGGDPGSLRKILGHSKSARQVLRYLELWGIDLKEAHARYSPMARRAS